MIALTLYRENVQAGVIIIHEATHTPVLVGESPLSALLLEKYTKGQTFIGLDKTRKRVEWVIPPVNFEKFMTIGTEYFEKASFTLSQKGYVGGETIEIEGETYKLRDIHGN